jgi:hypothetical protein
MPASWEASTAAALDSLKQMSTRDLLRTARALEDTYKRDAARMFRFAGTFRAVAFDRHERLKEPSRYTRIQVELPVILASSALAERLADAPEPSWRHVREAILAYQDESRCLAI